MLVACVDNVHKDNLTSRLNEQRKEGGVFCDVLLKISGQMLPTHSCILSASSPFFRKLILGDRPDPPHLLAVGVPQEVELVVPGKLDGPDDAVGLEAIIGLIDYIYTGKIEFDEDSVDLVVELAEAFMLEGLSTLIKNYKKDCVKNKKGPRQGLAKQMAAPNRRQRKASAPRKLVSEEAPRASITLKLPRITTTLKIPRSAVTKATRTTPIRAAAAKIVRSTAPASRGRRRKCTQPKTTRRKSAARVETSEEESSSSSASSSSEAEEAVEIKKGKSKKESKKSVSSSSAEESGEESNKSEEEVEEPVAKKAKKVKKVRQKYVFRCKRCDFVSANVPAIREHKLLHPGRSYTCLTCGFFAGQAAKLLEHLLSAETEASHVTETRCSLCQFEGSDQTAYREHLRKHDPLKPFLCHVCEYKCGTRAHLNAHLTTHTSDRPFSCDVCNARFKLKYCWQNHILTHEKGKVYLCDHCGFRTAYKHHLKMHEKIHTGEMMRCPHDGCTFQAYSKQNLNKHVLTHNNDKPRPYVCDICGHKYAQQQSLSQHLKMHDESKVLHCPHCQFRNYRRDKIAKHIRKWHSQIGGPLDPEGAGGGSAGGGGGGGAQPPSGQLQQQQQQQHHQQQHHQHQPQLQPPLLHDNDPTGDTNTSSLAGPDPPMPSRPDPPLLRDPPILSMSAFSSYMMPLHPSFHFPNN